MNAKNVFSLCAGGVLCGSAIAQDFRRAAAIAFTSLHITGGGRVVPARAPMLDPKPLASILGRAERLAVYPSLGFAPRLRAVATIDGRQFRVLLPWVERSSPSYVFAAASEASPEHLTFFELSREEAKELGNLFGLNR